MRFILFASLALAASAHAQTRCISIDELTAPANFRRFAVLPLPRPRWHAPDIRQGDAYAYRTALREGSHGPPNFAGRWTIVHIGCGAGAVCPAFVDRSTGRVRFVADLRVVATMDADFNDTTPAHDMLTYRPNSALLVVLGSPNEDQSRTGAHLFAWRNGDLARVRFVPERDLCGFTR